MKKTVPLIAMFLVLAGCDARPGKTDSQRYRDDADTQARAIVSKAQQWVNAETFNAPEQHLAELVLIHKRLRDVRKVYAEKGITQWQLDSYQRLQREIDQTLPQLALHAQALLNELIARTVALRQQIEEVKNRPYSAGHMDPSSMVQRLSEAYNRGIADCCTSALSDIKRLLLRDKETYADHITLLHNLTPALEKMIRSPAYIDTFRERVATLTLPSPADG